MEEKSPSERAGQRLSSASETIDALGGTKAVAELLGVGQSSVSNYRKQGFAARAHFTLSKICAERGLNVADAVFGGVNLRTLPPLRTAVAPHTRLADRLALDLFIEKGFEAINTPVLQPAAPFINRMGEEMRRRLYIFADPAGEALCLRPDHTIPTALAYLSENRHNRRQFAYEGMAFRYQPHDTGKPEEFIQAGIEIIGGTNSDNDDALVLRSVLQAVEALGVKNYQLRLNHLGLLPVFLKALGLTKRTLSRLTRAYHQSARLEDVVTQMTGEPPRVDARPALNPATQTPATETIAGRSRLAIQTRIEQLHEDVRGGLTQQQAKAVLAFLQLSGDIETVLAEIARLAPQAALKPLTDYWRRLVKDAGLAPHAPQLSLASGRKMAYYTGLSFEVIAPSLGAQSIIAAGGRYDDLLQALGAESPIGAVGGALTLERVELAAQLPSGRVPSSRVQGGRT